MPSPQSRPIPSSTNQRPFAVFDIDGTLFRWQLFHEMIFELIALGILPPQTEQTILTAQNAWRDRQHLNAFRDYELEVVKAIEQHLSGIPVAAFKQAAKTIMQRSGKQVYDYTRSLLDSLKKEGYLLFAISGSFIEIVEPFAKQYGFDDWAASICSHKDGVYTGQAAWMYNRKAKTLKAMVKRHDATYKNSVAVGDTANDIAILQMVERPIAFNPNRELFEYAVARDCKIVVERKNMAYQLESSPNGYILNI